MPHETETGEWQEAKRAISAITEGSQSLSVDQSDKSDHSVNKTMPWIALLAILSTAALVVSVMSNTLQKQATDAEKELRDQQFKVLWDKYQLVERECRLAQDDVTKYMQRGIK